MLTCTGPVAYRFALAALIAWPGASYAQGEAAATNSQPSACVRAVGPDLSPPPGDSTRQPSSSAMQRPATTRDTLPVAVRLIASVSADEIRFEKSPVVCVRLTGDAQLDSVHVLARKNLASPVVRGGSYRDVYVAVEILGRLNADCISARITGSAARGAAADSTTHCASLEARRPEGSP